MALTATLNGIITFSGEIQNALKDVPGRNYQFIADILLDHYPTGGPVVNAAVLGVNQVKNVIPLCTSGPYSASWDQTNHKLLLYVTGAAYNGVFTELANNSSVGDVHVYCFVEAL